MCELGRIRLFPLARENSYRERLRHRTIQVIRQSDSDQARTGLETSGNRQDPTSYRNASHCGRFNRPRWRAIRVERQRHVHNVALI